MKLFYFLKPEELDRFIRGEYLQSWQWGEILRAEGENILRVGVKSDSAQSGAQEILAAATLVKQDLGGGYSYWYAPRGPIFKDEGGAPRAAVAQFLFSEIRKIDKKMIFVRTEPASIPSAENFSFRKTINLQPAQTLMLDLSMSEGELLVAMGQKTRYNIRLAEKKGVKIKASTAADFPALWRLLKLTGERDGFKIHGAQHYEKMLAAPSDFIRLFFAEYEGKYIATGLFCFWGDRVTYLHGASENEFRSVMAPYLLQWSVIRLARAAGFSSYDFYGIDEKKWPGVTRFKLGFGGQRKEYPGTYDLVFRPGFYRIYGLARKLRRLI